MNKIKWGVIGCGGIADRQTIPGLMLAENAVLTAVMDLNYDLAKEVSAKYGNPTVCKDEFELLDMLNSESGLEIPKSRKSLKTKEIRFNTVCDKENMKAETNKFLD